MTEALNSVNGIVCGAGLVQDTGMKQHFRILLAGLVLTGCSSPVSFYYKSGGSVARMQTDATNCEVQALKSAPVANQVRQRPPIYFPGSQYCGPAGCYYSPGYWVDGGIYTVDVNKDLRRRVMDQCMGQRGYQPASLPMCSSAIRSQVTPKQTTRMPTLTADSCAINHGNGAWQIVTPSAPTSSSG